jgi:hypothetical protein
MKQLAPVIAAALIALPAAADATVIWSFYETAITSCNGGTCVLPPQPFVLLTLTLPGPTSAGTATWPPRVSGPRDEEPARLHRRQLRPLAAVRAHYYAVADARVCRRSRLPGKLARRTLRFRHLVDRSRRRPDRGQHQCRRVIQQHRRDGGAGSVWSDRRPAGPSLRAIIRKAIVIRNTTSNY